MLKARGCGATCSITPAREGQGNGFVYTVELEEGNSSNSKVLPVFTFAWL